MLAFKVHALADAAQFHLLEGVDDLQRHLTTAVACGKVDFSEAPASGGALDGVSIQRPVAVLVAVAFHRGHGMGCFVHHCLLLPFTFYTDCTMRLNPPAMTCVPGAISANLPTGLPSIEMALVARQSRRPSLT